MRRRLKKAAAVIPKDKNTLAQPITGTTRSGSFFPSNPFATAPAKGRQGISQMTVCKLDALTGLPTQLLKFLHVNRLQRAVKRQNDRHGSSRFGGGNGDDKQGKDLPAEKH